MASFHMMGEAWPIPGISVFHLRSFSSVQERGAFLSGQMPSPLGPRHPGQLSARRGVVKQAKRSAILRFILAGGEDVGWMGELAKPGAKKNRVRKNLIQVTERSLRLGSFFSAEKR